MFKKEKKILFRSRQTQGGNSDKRSPGHAQEGGDISKHGGWLPVRARSQAASGTVLARGLHMP